MVVSREVWGLRGGFEGGLGFSWWDTNKQEKKNTNKQEKHQQTRETPFEQGKRLSSKGYLPIKCKSLQVVGVSRQGKAVVSDVGYVVIGG